MQGILIHSLDLFSALIIAAGFAHGLRRGMVDELVSFLLIAVSGMGALFLAHPLAQQLDGWLTLDPRLAICLSFTALVFGIRTSFFCAWVWIHPFIQPVFDRRVDHACGGILGGLHSTIFVLLVLFTLSLWPDPQVNQFSRTGTIFGRQIVKRMPQLYNELDYPLNPPTANEN